MDKQRKEAKELAKNLPFQKKVEHIWMYYKWWIISAIVVVALLVGTIYDVMTRPSYDMEMALYSKKYISENTVAALEEYLSPMVPDLDGDGERAVKIYAVSIDLIGEEEGTAAVQTKLSTEILTGAYPVFLVDDGFYEILQLDGYRGAIESFREINEIKELSEILHLDGDEKMYWGTAVPYDDASVDVYDGAVQMETEIFGPRS